MGIRITCHLIMKKFKFFYLHNGELVSQIFVETTDSGLPRIREMFQGWECVALKEKDLLLDE